MTRELTAEQIEMLASRPRVRRIAVENFLGSIDIQDPPGFHYKNCDLDAELYRWNSETRNAICRGIQMAYTR